ncbi:MAG: AAA family ATPase [Parvibaculum sp.]
MTKATVSAITQDNRGSDEPYPMIPQQFDLVTLCGLQDDEEIGDAKIPVMGFEDVGNPFVAKVDPDYVFSRGQLRTLNAFFTAPYGDFLWVWGPKGAGKTSSIQQFAGRLNWPVQHCTGRERMEYADLVGQWMLIRGEWEWLDGPLTTAVRHGHVFLLDEADTLSPGELVGLNALRENGNLVIAEKGGEVIVPHKSFRLVITANSAGNGDMTGEYQSVVQQNSALRDGFRFIKIGYPSIETEEAILRRKVRQLDNATLELDGSPALFNGAPIDLLQGLTKLATDIRQLYLGSDDRPGEITTPISTRTLIRWARLLLMFSRGRGALKFSFDHAFGDGLDETDAVRLHQAAELVFGKGQNDKSIWSEATVRIS